MIGEIRMGNCGDCSQGSHNRPPGFINITYKRQPVYGSKTYRYGLEPYLVSSAIIGIISQRLVKVLCPKCKEKYEASDSEKRMMGIDEENEVTL